MRPEHVDRANFAIKASLLQRVVALPAASPETHYFVGYRRDENDCSA